MYCWFSTENLFHHPHPILTSHPPLPNHTEYLLPSLCSPLLKLPFFYTHTHIHTHTHTHTHMSDWTIIYFASLLANSVISSILALKSSCTLNPCLQHPRLCVWSVYPSLWSPLLKLSLFQTHTHTHTHNSWDYITENNWHMKRNKMAEMVGLVRKVNNKSRRKCLH
jgi:hypothetical protein